MASMLKANINTSDAIKYYMAGHPSPLVRATLATAREQIEEGVPAATAFKKTGKFDDKFISLVRAGSDSGQLDKAFDSIAKTLKKEAEFKAKMRKAIKAHEEKDATAAAPKQKEEGAIPAYLLDRNEVNRTKVLSNMIKQKRKEKAGKWKVPVEKVKAMSEEEMFKVLKSGKRKQKAWKRMINKVTFVSKDFVRKPPKSERFIRPTGLRFKKAHVTHPELKTTFCLDILGVKKNP
jgi:ribosomal protein S8E